MTRLARPLLYAGIFGVVFGLAKVHARYVADPPYDFTGSSRFGWTITYAIVLCVVAYGAGLPELPKSRRSILSTCVAASFGGAAVMSVVQLFVGDALLPRFVVFGSAILLPDWYRICTRIATGAREREELRDRVFVVADPADVEVLEAELAGEPERSAVVVGQLTTEEVVASKENVLHDSVGAAGATVVVLDRRAQLAEDVVAQVARLHESGARIRTLSMFYEEWLGKLPMSELERASLLFDIGELHRARYARVKRLLDLALSTAASIVLLVVLPFIVALNRLGNRGPLFYRQERVGHHGRVFTILKLRTMVPVAEVDSTTQWTAKDDPRVTRFGRILRQTHLDELPQVVNVLRGDLAIVGPRPEQPHYVELLSEKLPFYGLRHLVRPGMTGWAQVKYGYAGDEKDALEKLQYEFWYLRHQSLALDTRIIGRTIRSVTGRVGGGR